MKKTILALVIAVILIPQASFAASSYKGVPIKSGTDAEIAAQIAAIDANTSVVVTPSPLTDQIASILAQIKVLQTRLEVLEKESLKGNAAIIVPETERAALEGEMQNLMSGNWYSCNLKNPCEIQIKRVNEIRLQLNGQDSCGYEAVRKGPPVLVCT